MIQIEIFGDYTPDDYKYMLPRTLGGNAIIVARSKLRKIGLKQIFATRNEVRAAMNRSGSDCV